MSDCKAQLHILGQRLAKQRTAVSRAKEALERSQEKLAGLEEEVAKLDLHTESCLLILSRRLLQRWPLKLAMVLNWKRFSRVTTWISRTSSSNRIPPKPPAGSPPHGSDRLPPPASDAAFVQKLRMPPNGVVLRRRSRTIRCSMQLHMGSYLNRTVHSSFLVCVVCILWPSQPTACLSSLKAPSILIIGNRMSGFDACEQGWVLIQKTPTASFTRAR